MRRVVFTFRSMLLGSLAALSLSGCQQMAWKPGASASDLQRDTAACRAPNDDEIAVQNCLRQRGWVIRQAPKEAADDEAADADGSAASAIAPAAGVVSAPSPEPSSRQEPLVSGEPISTTNVPARDKLVPASAAPVTATATTAAATPAAAKKPKPIDPLKPKLVQSWWKVGAGAADLAADQAACVDTLGPAHQPDLQKRLYSHGLIDCLRGRGWSGY